MIVCTSARSTALLSHPVESQLGRFKYPPPRVLAKLWMRGYRRMLLVRINAGPAMQNHFAARAAVEVSSTCRARRSVLASARTGRFAVLNRNRG